MTIITDIDGQPSILVAITLMLWVFAPYVIGRTWFVNWRSEKRPNWQLLMIPVILLIILAVEYNNDTALIVAYNLDNGGTLPYGRLWFILNPFYGTTNVYLWFIVAWSLAFLSIMWFLVKHQKLSVTWVYWCEIMNIILILIHNPQSVVPMSFVYLAPALGPAMLAIAAAIKLPFGWFPPFSNRHWQCAFGNVLPTGAPSWECIHFTPGYFLVSADAIYNFIVYIMISYWLIQGLRLWLKTHKKIFK